MTWFEAIIDFILISLASASLIIALSKRALEVYSFLIKDKSTEISTLSDLYILIRNRKIKISINNIIILSNNEPLKIKILN